MIYGLFSDCAVIHIIWIWKLKLAFQNYHTPSIQKYMFEYNFTLIGRSFSILWWCYINWCNRIKWCKWSRSSRHLLQKSSAFRVFTTLVMVVLSCGGAGIITSCADVLICAIDATICWMTTVHASIDATLLLGSVATLCCCLIHYCALLLFVYHVNTLFI